MFEPKQAPKPKPKPQSDPFKAKPKPEPKKKFKAEPREEVTNEFEDMMEGSGVADAPKKFDPFSQDDGLMAFEVKGASQKAAKKGAKF